MFKFIHAADLHVDSPLRGLDRRDDCPVDAIRGASRRAVENLVDLALAEKVGFVLLAGDIYDGEWNDHNTGLWFVRQMARLKDQGIRVVAIKGNHDAESKIPTHLHLPSNVKELSSRKPETFRIDDFNVAVHGQGFKTAKVTENLAEAYPEGARGWFNIGLLHTCAEGREGHERYSPCTVEQMKAKRFDYDYWALGHIHQRDVLHQAHPFIAFSGNIQGRHIRETGPKGCLLVNVGDDQSVEAEFRPLDVLRWDLCVVDASGVTDGDELLDRFGDKLRSLVEAADGRPLAARVEIKGSTPLHSKLNARSKDWDFKIRGLASESQGEAVWIEKIAIKTTATVELSADPSSLGSIGELVDLVRELKSRPEALREFVDKELGEFRKKLEQEVKDADEFLGLDSDESLGTLIDQVEALVLDRLSV